MIFALLLAFLLLTPYLLVLLALPHQADVLLLVQDLLHLAVLQVVQLPHRVLSALDQVHQHPWRPLPPHKVMLGRAREGQGEGQGQGQKDGQGEGEVDG